MLTFMMCEIEERDVDKLTTRIKSKLKLIQTFLIEIRRFKIMGIKTMGRS